EALLRWTLKGLHHWANSHAKPGQHEHLPGLLATLLLGLLRIAAFAIGCFIATTAFDWPPLIRAIALGALMATPIARTAVVFARGLLGISADGKTELPAHRVIPMDSPSAWFWYRRSVALVAWFAYGWITVTLLMSLGFTLPAMQIVAYILGIGLLVI